MSQQPLLSGEQEYVEHAAPDPRIVRLETEVRDLKRKLTHAELESVHAKEDVGRMMASLRGMTLPFYNLLRAIHGEIDAMGIVEPASASTPITPQFDQAWDAWKQKLGKDTATAKVIDAILSHGPLNRNQLRVTCQVGWSTLDAATARLKNLSLIEKIGDKWDLKK